MMMSAYLYLFSKISISGGVNSLFSDPFKNWNGDSSCCNILEVTLKQEFKKKNLLSRRAAQWCGG